MYLNRITLIGFLGSDAEVRTANKSTLAVLSLATKSSYKDKKTGEYVSHTEWHRAIVWGKLAEYAKTLTKGSHLQIEGELRKDIRSDLARTVVQSGWGLLELQSASMSLEDIFLKLTTAEEAEKAGT